MRVKLLIASCDNDYTEHLSAQLSRYHADEIDVSVCKRQELLNELLAVQKYDAALIEEPFISGIDFHSVPLPLLLWTEEEGNPGADCELMRVRKYQRVSTIVASILENYAKVSKDGHYADSERGAITAVWSPAGGVGKTTVALAYAARKAAEGKQVLYLNLETFSSAPVYFEETGRSISAVFEMLESNDGDVKTLIRGIRNKDRSAGITYLCGPDNFDDMNILSDENISSLIAACAGVTDELVVDMACVCDERSRRVFELADRVFLVTDHTSTAQSKLSQFATQHNMFTLIKEKTALIANKGSTALEPQLSAVVHLPLIPSTNVQLVYKSLANLSFEV